MDGGALQAAWPSSFPELATERLRLRAPLPRDAAALLGILGDPEVTRYHNMPTLTTLAEAHAALERLQQRYRGLTPEAVAAVIRYGFSVLGLHRIEAGVLPGNDASVRVLQKLGFLEEGPRRDYLYSKGRFHSFRWFSLLETDEPAGTAR